MYNTDASDWDNVSSSDSRNSQAESGQIQKWMVCQVSKGVRLRERQPTG